MQKSEPSRAPGVSLESLESRLVLAVVAPTGLDAMLVEPRGVRVVWNDVAGETGYLVERRIDGTTEPFAVVGEPGADVTQFTQDGLTPGRTYIYRVRARDAAGRSEASNTDFVTIPGLGVPDAPRELVAEVVQGQFVRLRWANVSGETGYRVERRFEGSGSGDWVEIGNTAENVVTFADERVERGRSYAYRVRAFNGAGSSPYSNVAFVTVAAEPGVPAAPRELNAELIDGPRVKVTWNNVEGETGFKVERRVDGTTDWVQIGTTAQNVLTFIDERVERGKAYIYRVRAFNDAGNSSYSNTDAVLIPGEAVTPAAPRLEVQVIGPRAARLNWTNVANETGYRIERRVDGSPEGFREIRSVGADVTTITDDGLEPGNTYLYRVRAFNSAGNSAYSNIGVASLPREGLPTAPRELRATAVSPTRVELRWVDSSLETGYRIERRLDGTDAWTKIGNAPANATSFVDATARPGQAYIYRVRAYNDIGNSPWSNTAVARTPGEGTVPDAPRELDATLTDGNRVRLRWNDVLGERGYKIERRLDGTGSGDWAQIGTTGENVTTSVDERVEPGRTYVYRVRAFNDAGNSPYSNTDAVTIPTGTAVPEAPRLEAALVAPRAARLTWTNVANENGYRIERRVDGSTEGFREIRSVGANVTTITDDGLEVGKTYLYRVRAFNGAGSSGYSNVRAVAVVNRPSAPRDLRATAVSPTRIDLRWIGVDGETGYRIERRLDGTDAWAKVAFVGVDVTTFSDTTVQPNRTYVYRVRAGGPEDSSAWSNTAAAKTPEAPPAGGATVFSTTRIRALALEGA